MYDTVRNAFVKVTAPLDGQVNHMYCDNNRIVTCAVGVRLPTPADASMISWRWKDTNKRATAAEIKAEWVAIRQIGQTGPDNSRTHTYYSNYAQLEMTPAEMYRATLTKLLDVEDTAAKPKGYRYWPADAQMAFLQIVWDGSSPPEDVWKILVNEDWNAAVELYPLQNTNRDILIKHLFSNARTVDRLNLNKAKYWGDVEPGTF